MPDVVLGGPASPGRPFGPGGPGSPIGPFELWPQIIIEPASAIMSIPTTDMALIGDTARTARGDPARTAGGDSSPLGVVPLIESLEPCRRETRFFAIEWFNRARDEHKLSYMIVAARTLERALFVTRSHLGFVRRHFDQVHLSAAPRTFHVGRPFTFNTNGCLLSHSPRGSGSDAGNAPQCRCRCGPKRPRGRQSASWFSWASPTPLALARHCL